MNPGLATLLIILAILVAAALRRGVDLGPVARRFLEQLAMLGPRMLCALVAAGFISQLIPKQAIAGLMGTDAGVLAILVAAAAGLVVPAGPVIAFAVAAVFAKSGASAAAIVTFLTSWTVFAAHRILIYEIPLMGIPFVRLRIASVALAPFLAGGLAILAGVVTGDAIFVPTR